MRPHVLDACICSAATCFTLRQQSIGPVFLFPAQRDKNLPELGEYHVVCVKVLSVRPPRISDVNAGRRMHEP